MTEKTTLKQHTARLAPGVALCILIGAAGFLLGKYIPIGSVTLAIIIGIIIGNARKPGERFRQGITFSEKKILSCAIALLGVELNFSIVRELGLRSLLLIIGGMALTITTALLIGKLFRFDRKFSLLLGIGNGICGSSAIAAAKPIIGADEEEAGLSIAIVNFLGTIGIFLLPFLATGLLKLDDLNAGLLTGNTLQAMGQVMAAGGSISEATGGSAGLTAALVKMTRILMLTPVLIILIFSFSGKTESEENSAPRKFKIPLFIIFFILFSFIPTFGLLPKDWIEYIAKTSKYLLIIAMAGIGMKITFSSILKDGWKALIIGAMVWAVQLLFSGTLLYFFFK